MAERRDIPDALREAVERTVQATVGTRELAQGAASDLSASVDDLVKGAEKGITRSRRSVTAAVGERLPASHDDVKAIRAELRRIGKRLDAIEERLPAAKPAGTGSTGKAKTAGTGSAAKARSAKTAKAKPAKTGSAAKSRSAAKPKPQASARRKPGAGSKAKPQR